MAAFLATFPAFVLGEMCGQIEELLTHPCARAPCSPINSVAPSRIFKTQLCSYLSTPHSGIRMLTGL